MVPKFLAHISFEACILRAILSVQSCGTWQSGQLARTPERLEKWIVDFNSANTLSRISWQEVQKFSVLVSSSPVLKAPQNITPATKPASTSTPRLNTLLGRRSTVHNSRANAVKRPPTVLEVSAADVICFYLFSHCSTACRCR